MRRITIMEVVLLLVVIFLLGSTGYFYYRLAVDDYVQAQEKWKTDVIQLLNHNYQIGVLKSPGTPQPVPQKEGPKK